MLQDAAACNQVLKVHRQHQLRFGLGCSSGDMCLAIIGSIERMSTLAISEAVQLANLAESKTRELKVDFLVTDVTYSMLTVHKEDFRCVARAGDHWVYECLQYCSPAARQLREATRPLVEGAVHLFHRREWARARSCFKKVAARDPGDGVARFYLEALEDSDGLKQVKLVKERAPGVHCDLDALLSSRDVDVSEDYGGAAEDVPSEDTLIIHSQTRPDAAAEGQPAKDLGPQFADDTLVSLCLNRTSSTRLAVTWGW